MTKTTKYVPRGSDASQRLEHNKKIHPDGHWTRASWSHPTSYGKIYFEGKSWPAHRLAARVYLNVSLEPGVCILHKCDQPWCYNPKHLRPGTQADNIADCKAKGRLYRGKKLNPDKVLEIRTRLETGDSHATLAEAFGVSKTTIGQIKRNEIWKEVKPQPAAPADLSNSAVAETISDC